MRASRVSPSNPETKGDDRDVDALLFIPFIDALTFGDTAERAVAPRAMVLAVGEACEDDIRRGGVARELAAVAIVVGMNRKREKDRASYVQLAFEIRKGWN